VVARPSRSGVKRARQSVKDAASMGHPVPLSRALVWPVSVFL
jgi:hypothetical protein